MKRIISLLLKAAMLVQMLAAVSCTPESLEEATDGLSLKAFMPTVVMAGGEMVVTGNHLDQVLSVVFPGGIEVKDFQVVTSNQIKVRIPSGISREGGPLTLVSADKKVESAVSMRLAQPVVKSLDPGDETKPGRTLTFKGEDLDCIIRVSFPAKEEGETVEIEAMDFQRKSPDNIKVTVPEGIVDGKASMTLTAIDGSILTTPEILFVAGPSADDDYIVATIMNVAAGRYLTRSSASTPVIMDRTGGKNQEFTFIPVEGEYGTYYMRNNDTEDYLSIGEEYEWRMGWYADPSDVPVPANAKFQVFPIPGTDGFYRIHAMGSVDFGIDSTDDGSEVYSNKSGSSNSYYQWVINRLSGPDFRDPNAEPPADDKPVVIWEGSAEPNPDDNGWVSLYLEPELFTTLTVGQSIRMYFTPTEGQWLSLDFRDKNDGAFPGYEWAGMSDFPTYAEGYIDMEVNEDVHDRVRAGGISLRGFWFTITKVELVGSSVPQPGLPETIIWEGSWDCGGWSGNQDLAWGGFDWTKVAAGTVMVMYFTEDDTQGWWQIALRHGDGWEELPENNFFELSVGQTMLEVPLTQVMLDDINAHNGLIITGCNYVLTKITLREP